MKKLFSVASMVAMTAGIGLVAASPAHAATNRTEAVRLTIADNSPCKAGRTVMQGMTVGPNNTLYIIFTKAKGAEPLISRWTRDGAAWDGSSWVCAEARSMPEVGHGNDLTYHPNYLARGPHLIATQGSQSAFLSPRIAIIGLNTNGTFSAPSPAVLTLPMNISGLCYSATANRYVARRLQSLWTHPISGALTSGWTLQRSNLTIHDNRSDQGLDCTENYVWNTNSIKPGSTPADAWNWVYQYNWSGADVETDIGVTGNTDTDEIEDITHVGSDFFIGINRNGGLADYVKVFVE